MTHRPDDLVVVLGTGTEVGKTWVSCRYLSAARAAGLTVAARKPIQSFDPASGEATDAELLAAATGESADAVCPPTHWLPVPMSPPMAASVLSVSCPTNAELIAAIEWTSPVSIGLVETVGGVRSPLSRDGDSGDLAAVLRPDRAVLVADAGLGTINAVRLSLAAVSTRLGPAVPVTIVLNRFDQHDDLHRRNRDWLRERDGLRVVTDPEELLQ